MSTFVHCSNKSGPLNPDHEPHGQQQLRRARKVPVSGLRAGGDGRRGESALLPRRSVQSTRRPLSSSSRSTSRAGGTTWAAGSMRTRRWRRTTRTARWRRCTTRTTAIVHGTCSNSHSSAQWTRGPPQSAAWWPKAPSTASSSTATAAPGTLHRRGPSSSSPTPAPATRRRG
jgi:hypothetical protein